MNAPNPHRRPVFTQWRTAVKVLTLLAYSAHQMHAHAAGSLPPPVRGNDAPASSKVKPAANATEQKRLGSVRFIRSSSEETQAQRTKRLKRECKGLPNAGACRGMTD